MGVLISNVVIFLCLSFIRNFGPASFLAGVNKWKIREIRFEQVTVRSNEQNVGLSCLSVCLSD